MERKTKVHAENGQSFLLITREFELPVTLLFKAYSDPDLVGQWMGTQVVKLESRKHGSWQFQTTDAQGKVVFQAHGVIHEFIRDRKITRTFEMENAPFDVQLEFLEFEALGDDKSKLSIHTVFKTVAHRDAMLKMPFAQGLNMAHNRLQQVAGESKVTS